MAQKAENIPITIKYGCSDTHVLMEYSMPISNNIMTIEQAEAMRTQLAEAIAMLKKHQAELAAKAY